MTSVARFTIAIALLAALRSAVVADEPVRPFAERRKTVSLGFGSAKARESEYFVAAVGVGYFAADGFEVGIRGERWFSGDPGVTMVEPNLRYVVFQLEFPAKPYLGVFLRRWFVDNNRGLTTVGPRLGVVSVQGRYSITLGARFEWRTDCYECDPVFSPEVGVSVSF
jgi:hypothetical protein